MKVCPNCGKVAFFNSYFNAYMCNYCGWENRLKRHDKFYYKIQVSKREKNSPAKLVENQLELQH